MLFSYAFADFVLLIILIDILEDHACLLGDGLRLSAVKHGHRRDILHLFLADLWALELAHLEQVIHAEDCKQLGLGVVEVGFRLEALRLNRQDVVQYSSVKNVVHCSQVRLTALNHG